MRPLCEAPGAAGPHKTWRSLCHRTARTPARPVRGGSPPARASRSRWSVRPAASSGAPRRRTLAHPSLHRCRPRERRHWWPVRGAASRRTALRGARVPRPRRAAGAARRGRRRAAAPASLHRGPVSPAARSRPRARCRPAAGPAARPSAQQRAEEATPGPRRHRFLEPARHRRQVQQRRRTDGETSPAHQPPCRWREARFRFGQGSCR